MSLGFSEVGVFKQVFGMGFFLSACYQRCFIWFFFYSVMPQDEPISSGVGPEVQEAIKHAFSDLSANLTTVIESRLSDFKRDLVEERDSSVASVVKRVKRNEVEFKSKGNKNSSSSRVSSKFLIALLRLNIPWPALSTKRQRELSKKV